MRASREEILSQPLPSMSTQKFKIGYFSPVKRRASISASSGGHLTDYSESSNEDVHHAAASSTTLNEPDTSLIPLSSSPPPSASALTDNEPESEPEPVPEMPPRKRKKTRHISADKALLLESTQNSSSGLPRRQRPERSYARVKRSYI